MRKILAILLLLALSNAFSTQDVLFTDSLSLQRWQYANGDEFPGAVGGIEIDKSDANAPHLRLDMNLSAGGRYTGALYTLPKPLKLYSFSAQIKIPTGINLFYRVKDSTGQTLTYPSIRPPFAGVNDWFEDWICLKNSPVSFFGGANNGIVNGPIQSIALILDPFQYPQKTSYVKLQSLRLYDRSTESLIDPAKIQKKVDATKGLAEHAGVSIHFVHGEALLDSISSAGFSYIRTDLTWYVVESRPGSFDYSLYDSLNNGANRRKLKTLFILDYNNPHYSPPTARNRYNDAIEDSLNRVHFARFCGESARHFRNRNVSWEVWNEPDQGQFPPEAFGLLFQACQDSIMRADPSATVLTGGVMNGYSYITSLLMQPGVVKADGFALHPYTLGDPEASVQTILTLQQAIQEKFGVNKRVYSTEWGYSNYMQSEESSSIQKAVADSTGNAISRVLTLCALMDLPMCILYDIHDDGPNLNDKEHNFGLLNSHFGAKPAWLAVRSLIKNLGHATSFEILQPSTPNVWAIKISRQGRDVIFVWAREAQQAIKFIRAPKRVQDPFGKEYPTRPKTTSFTISRGVWTFEF